MASAEDRQKSLVSSLTYELMNPVCLVQKGREMRSMIRKEQRRQIRESMQTMQL